MQAMVEMGYEVLITFDQNLPYQQVNLVRKLARVNVISPQFAKRLKNNGVYAHTQFVGK